MGTTHYLIDDEGKNALCVEKWYALSPECWDDVTDVDLDAARECEKVGDEFAGVLADTAKAWRRDVAKGRTLRLATDNADFYPWQNEDYTEIPGWTVYRVDGEGGWVVDFTTSAAAPTVSITLALGPPPNMLDSANHPGVVLVFPAPPCGDLLAGICAGLERQLSGGSHIVVNVAPGEAMRFGIVEDEA